MLNLSKILKIFQKYDKIYKESIEMKKIYTKLLKFFTIKNKLPISDLDLNLGIDVDEDINWREPFKDIQIFQNFFISIKQNKINFQTGKIYCKFFFIYFYSRR